MYCSCCGRRMPEHANWCETEAFRKTSEEAWNQGYTSGHSNAMRKMSDEPDAPTTPNPYTVENYNYATFDDEDE